MRRSTKDKLYWQRQIWAGVGKPIMICPSLLTDGRDPATGLGELHAVTFAMSVLRQFYTSGNVSICTKRECSRGTCLSKSCHHIYVGGPVNNDGTRYFEKTKGIQFVKDDKETLIAPFHHGESLRARFLDKKDPFSVTSDYGLLNWYVDEETGARTVACVGSHTYGSYASVVALFSSEFSEVIVRNDLSVKGFGLAVRMDKVEKMGDKDQEHPVTFLSITDQSITLPPPINQAASLTGIIDSMVLGARWHKEHQKARMYGTLLAYVVTGLTLLSMIWFLKLMQCH